MKTRFKTNVDCCKQFMGRMSDQFGNSYPLVGDIIDVYKAKDKIVEMEVCGRKLTTEHAWSTDQDISVLIVELYMTPFWQQMGLPRFEKHVKGQP